MTSVPADWWARVELAEEFAREAVAAAHGLDVDSPDLPLAFPAEFAGRVHEWSLAHPPPPPPGGADYAQAGGVTRLTRLTDGRVMCQLCYEHVFWEDLAAAEEGGRARTDVCRRCAVKGREAAGEGR